MSKYVIELNSWEYECGDGCCYDYGLELIVNGESLTRHFDPSNGSFPEVLQELLDKCEVDSKIINTDEIS